MVSARPGEVASMETRRVPNPGLRALLAQTGWTGEELARTVNRLGAEAGLRLRYRRPSVAQWLAGVHPRPPVPDLVAEGLSRALGRRVTVAEVWLGRGPRGNCDVDPLWDVDAVASLVGISGGTAGRRELLAGCVYNLAALAVPSMWELATTPGRAGISGGSRKVCREDVASVTLMTRLFSDSDTAFGGGQARPALSAYLSSTVLPWLRADASPAVRRDLLAAAAKLAYLYAFVCFDDELHGAAQRCYLAGLRLAADAGDNVDYAVILRAMSVQARVLGHHQQAMDLAEAAVRTATMAPPHTQAFLLGQLAVATAATGDRHAAVAHLSAAERSLEHASTPAGPVGRYHPASLAHQRATVAVCLGDHGSAIAALRDSIRHRPDRERRSRAVTLAALAELQLAEGRLEQACATWGRFLDDYRHLRSGRADTALATLRSRALPHRNNAAARALLRRAATIGTTRDGS
jgi:hypothetical protein